jgi:uncharacterized protein (DUF2336 family)
LPATVSAALAEVGSLPACAALIDNPTAAPTEAALLRILERFGAHAELREALLRRGELPARVRERLMAMVSAALKNFVIGRGWLAPERAERVARDAEQRGALALAADERLDLGEVVSCLKEGGRLTPAFIVHALLSGRTELVAAMLADLGGTPRRRVAAFLGENRRAPLLALLKRAGIPSWLAPLFPVAILEMRKAAAEGAQAAASTPLRLSLRRILVELEATEGEGHGRLAAYLRGMEAEAARAEARELAAAMITLDEAEREAVHPMPEYAAIEAADETLSGFDAADLHESATSREPIDLDAVAVARAA